ncbi:MAG: hypothetical protein GXY47_06000 [Acidobacteria bacterium]|nr:hypothetical protein [Acidobacteriota bacterium]
MKRKTIMHPLALVAWVFSGLLLAAPAQDNSPTNPAPVGTPVPSMVELGSVSSNIYDITVTTLEVVRGREALDRLKATSASNPAPPAGLEYLLARVRFELKGRSVSDKMGIEIGDTPLQWVALGSDLTEYARPSVTVPAPALAGTVPEGGSLEGWAAFVVDVQEAAPIMVFDPDTGGGTGRGKTLFFKLYR